MKLNVAEHSKVFTHEGAPAALIDAEAQLRRSVMSCLLWEREFYEDGEAIAERIVRLAEQLPPWKVSYLACEAREQSHLRHVPLLLLSVLAKTGKGHKEVADIIARVIQRADELTEFLAIHAKLNGTTPDKVKNKLSAQIKKGLARAFTKFDEYQLAKYDRDGPIRLRDALFLCHAKPENKKQAALWKRLADNKLKTPDTWEVALSAGADKKATFERLIRDGKLGYLALLRNLRNMEQAGCDADLVKAAIRARKGAGNVLPFRYVAAARAAPQYEDALQNALLAAIGEQKPLTGKTVVVVDVSGSMYSPLSGKSDMQRVDAAAALASVINADRRVIAFGTSSTEVPARPGLSGVDAILHSGVGGGTNLQDAIDHAERIPHDRLIVITDEQSHQAVRDPKLAEHAYMINVASYQHGVGYGSWVHIDGWSEGVIRFIHEYEKANGRA
jgi:60 kDa SS-A/Ro ribonucleoprotein